MSDKWEYKVLRGEDGFEIIYLINQLGEDGWEAYAHFLNHNQYERVYLKRKVQE